MNIANLVAMLLKRKSFWIILSSVLLLKALETLYVTIGIDFTGDSHPDLHVVRTPSYLGLDLNGDENPEYLIGEKPEFKQGK